jgi:hypothetical protein
MEAAVVGLISTVLGAVISSFAGWMNNNYNYRLDRQKLADQQEKESREQIREKLEEAHQLLSKIRTETTLDASDSMRKTDVTHAHEQQQHQKSNEDVHRLQMIADLYFPQIHDLVEELAKLATRFWRQHNTVTFLAGREEPERFKADWSTALREIPEISQDIGLKVADAKNRLREVSASFFSAGS